jgi:D-3-phosphoglycerate dehydrogenase
MALGFMLALCRNLFVTSNSLKQGTWNKSGGSQLSGKTVGIVGFGHIGADLVKLLSPFGCRILVNDIRQVSQDELLPGVELASKATVLKESDIISIHTPLNASTANLFDSKTFLQMKRGAFLVNTARGGIIAEDDLLEALKSGQLAGAALDVYMDEPPENMELLGLPQLICTPHIGGNALEAVMAMGMAAIAHLKEFKAVS